jgi:hypothetical protein
MAEAAELTLKLLKLGQGMLWRGPDKVRASERAQLRQGTAAKSDVLTKF